MPGQLVGRYASPVPLLRLGFPFLHTPSRSMRTGVLLTIPLSHWAFRELSQLATPYSGIQKAISSSNFATILLCLPWPQLPRNRKSRLDRKNASTLDIDSGVSPNSNSLLPRPLPSVYPSTVDPSLCSLLPPTH